MQHTVIALMKDRPGVLNRAVSLFRRRGFNIDSLSVASTEAAGFSRMTVVVNRNEVEQVVRQLERLVDIVSVRDVTHDRTVEHEMCLVRLSGGVGSRMGELLAIARTTDARIVAATVTEVVLALMNTPAEITASLERLRPFGVLELTRSGRIAIDVGAPPPRSEGGSPECHTAPFTWQADGVGDDDAAA